MRSEEQDVEQSNPQAVAESLENSALRTPHSALGRLLGVDHGTVRVGLALCDPDRLVASPLETYTRRTPDLDAAHLRALAERESIVAAVVGLPISLNGTEGPAAKLCREYGAWFAAATGLPVAFHDERFTSSAADELMMSAKLNPKQRQARRDKLAAMLMLQGYLDKSRAETRRRKEEEDERD